MSLKEFYNDPYFQFRSFAFNAALGVAVCAALILLRPAEFYRFDFSWWQLLYVPLGIYLGGLSAVYIHNATHSSFPNRWLNELCGYVAGVHQLWGFRGWKLIHLVHHQYSDQQDMDPHPPKGLTFWQFVRVMSSGSSRTISKRYAEHWGQGSRTRLLQAVTILLLFTMAGSFLLFWFLLLGPVGFVLGYVPSYVTNHMLFCSINYHCHPLDEKTGETVATNLNHNLYYKLANFLWHGIYFHGNHHKRPLLFNPRKMQVRQRTMTVPEAANDSTPELKPVPVLSHAKTR